ncbi:Tudor/PWWP/MBT [Backusella circina FSU 941]|nr:Tudor/PWWP/MBT [Backusella circina FSU 941]
MTQEEDTAEGYTPGTIVFAKLKGYPWWPARIESDQEMPEKVLKKKSRNKAALYNVFFYGSRDYGFFGPDAIRPFNPVNVQDDLDAKKFRTRDLEIAIRQALNPTYLDEFPSEQEKYEEERVLKQRGRKRKTPLNGKVENGQLNGSEHKRKVSEDINEMQKKRQYKKPMVIRENVHDRHKRSPEYRKIYHLRHKLQQLVYNKKKGDIPIGDYVKVLDVIKEIEKVDMTYVYLRDSKISKVVKAARFYPFETEIEIGERCQKLLRCWKYKFIELHSSPKGGTVNY